MEALKKALLAEQLKADQAEKDAQAIPAGWDDEDFAPYDPRFRLACDQEAVEEAIAAEVDWPNNCSAPESPEDWEAWANRCFSDSDSDLAHALARLPVWRWVGDDGHSGDCAQRQRFAALGSAELDSLLADEVESWRQSSKENNQQIVWDAERQAAEDAAVDAEAERLYQAQLGQQ